MNSVVVLIIGFVVFFIGYRVYAKHIDTKVMKADPRRSPRPRCIWTEWNSCPPARTSSSLPVQIDCRGGTGHCPIVAIQWGWLPAMLWLLLGALFIGGSTTTRAPWCRCEMKGRLLED